MHSLRRSVSSAAAVLAIVGALPAAMAGSVPPPAPSCLFEAANFHQVNPWILRAIIWQETKNKPLTIVRNKDNSVDVGIAGINSIHFDDLARHGVAPRDLLDTCTNLYVSAWHLKKQMKRFGNSWKAVGAYNSKTPSKNAKYAQAIHAILQDWGVISQ